MARVKKDDFVEVISGKDKGRTGKVLRIFPEQDKCLVEKVAIAKRHQKAKQAGTPSGIIEKPMKIHLCKVMPLDPKTKKPSRVRMVVKGDKKVRHYIKSGEAIDSAAPTKTKAKA